MTFEIKDRDAAGRIGKFTTKHGPVPTPTLLPVINPNKMLITPREMKNLFGTEMVITNAYIINKDPDLREKAVQNGVHRFIDFDGPIMTDSGTFQSYVYGDINLDPLEIVAFQRDIGSDVGTILDVFGPPDQTKKKAEQGVAETIQRAHQSIKIKKDMLLACTVQGSIYPELREKCAQELSKIDTDFFPIGGIVPLLENQRYSDVIRCIIAAKRGLNPSKPVHLFGAGHPLIFPLAVALGCDFFDSSAYAKYATGRRMIFPWGTEKLDDLSELPCCCPVCTAFTAAELKKMEENDAVLHLAQHNLYVSFAELKRIRNAIAEGTLWEVVERRATSNPHLLMSLQKLRKKEHKEWLAQFEPLSKKRAVFYTGNHTIHRPLIYRCHTRLFHRYESLFDTTVVLPEGKKPYSKSYSREIDAILAKSNVNMVVNSSLGPVPLELDEMYPFAQSVFPEVTDNETEAEARRIFDAFAKNKDLVLWKGNETLKMIPKSKEKRVTLDRWKISAVADMQFGKGASKALFRGTLEIVKSKKTGKIRNVYRNGKHLVSMRAEDGMFTLRSTGGRFLHHYFKYPKLRVVVAKDAVPFVKEGKSVFAKFVVDCDPGIIPFDECLIVDETDTLLAVGRTLLNRFEMLAFDHGVAVKTRETVE